MYPYPLVKPLKEIEPSCIPLGKPVRDSSIPIQSNSLSRAEILTPAPRMLGVQNKVRRLEKELEDSQLEKEANLIYNAQFKKLYRLMGNENMEFQELKRLIQNLLAARSHSLQTEDSHQKEMPHRVMHESSRGEISTNQKEATNEQHIARLQNDILKRNQTIKKITAELETYKQQSNQLKEKEAQIFYNGETLSAKHLLDIIQARDSQIASKNREIKELTNIIASLRKQIQQEQKQQSATNQLMKAQFDDNLKESQKRMQQAVGDANAIRVELDSLIEQLKQQNAELRQSQLINKSLRSTIKELKEDIELERENAKLSQNQNKLHENTIKMLENQIVELKKQIHALRVQASKEVCAGCSRNQKLNERLIIELESAKQESKELYSFLLASEQINTLVEKGIINFPKKKPFSSSIGEGIERSIETKELTFGEVDDSWNEIGHISQPISKKELGIPKTRLHESGIKQSQQSINLNFSASSFRNMNQEQSGVISELKNQLKEKSLKLKQLQMKELKETAKLGSSNGDTIQLRLEEELNERRKECDSKAERIQKYRKVIEKDNALIKAYEEKQNKFEARISEQNEVINRLGVELKMKGGVKGEDKRRRFLEEQIQQQQSKVQQIRRLSEISISEIRLKMQHEQSIIFSLLEVISTKGIGESKRDITQAKKHFEQFVGKSVPTPSLKLMAEDEQMPSFEREELLQTEKAYQQLVASLSAYNEKAQELEELARQMNRTGRVQKDAVIEDYSQHSISQQKLESIKKPVSSRERSQETEQKKQVEHSKHIEQNKQVEHSKHIEQNKYTQATQPKVQFELTKSNLPASQFLKKPRSAQNKGQAYGTARDHHSEAYMSEASPPEDSSDQIEKREADKSGILRKRINGTLRKQERKGPYEEQLGQSHCQQTTNRYGKVVDSKKLIAQSISLNLSDQSQQSIKKEKQSGRVTKPILITKQSTHAQGQQAQFDESIKIRQPLHRDQLDHMASLIPSASRTDTQRSIRARQSIQPNGLIPPNNTQHHFDPSNIEVYAQPHTQINTQANTQINTKTEKQVAIQMSLFPQLVAQPVTQSIFQLPLQAKPAISHTFIPFQPTNDGRQLLFKSGPLHLQPVTQTSWVDHATQSIDNLQTVQNTQTKIHQDAISFSFKEAHSYSNQMPHPKNKVVNQQTPTTTSFRPASRESEKRHTNSNHGNPYNNVTTIYSSAPPQFIFMNADVKNHQIPTEPIRKTEARKEDDAMKTYFQPQIMEPVRDTSRNKQLLSSTAHLIVRQESPMLRLSPNQNASLLRPSISMREQMAQEHKKSIYLKRSLIDLSSPSRISNLPQPPIGQYSPVAEADHSLNRTRLDRSEQNKGTSLRKSQLVFHSPPNLTVRPTNLSPMRQTIDSPRFIQVLQQEPRQLTSPKGMDNSQLNTERPYWQHHLVTSSDLSFSNLPVRVEPSEMYFNGGNQNGGNQNGGNQNGEMRAQYYTKTQTPSSQEGRRDTVKVIQLNNEYLAGNSRRPTRLIERGIETVPMSRDDSLRRLSGARVEMQSQVVAREQVQGNIPMLKFNTVPSESRGSKQIENSHTDLDLSDTQDSGIEVMQMDYALQCCQQDI